MAVNPTCWLVQFVSEAVFSVDAAHSYEVDYGTALGHASRLLSSLVDNDDNFTNW